MSSEDTQTTKENEALIQDMLRKAQKAEVPSELKENPVVHKGDETLPAPMVVSRVDDANYYYMYDSRTGEKIPVLGYMMSQKLRQRRPDGSFRFTTVDPGFRPKAGTFKCMLHKDHPNRPHYDELGFRVCPKANITNQYQLTQHMKKRHPQEWAAIEKERTDKEKEEDRALQRLLLAAQLGKVEGMLGVAENKPTESKSMGTGEPTNVVAPVEKEKFVCPKCGKEFAYRKTYRKHIKECK